MRGGSEWILKGQSGDSLQTWLLKSYGKVKPTPAQIEADRQLIGRIIDILGRL
jgi:hypothetical protein